MNGFLFMRIDRMEICGETFYYHMSHDSHIPRFIFLESSTWMKLWLSYFLKSQILIFEEGARFNDINLSEVDLDAVGDVAAVVRILIKKLVWLVEICRILNEF